MSGEVTVRWFGGAAEAAGAEEEAYPAGTLAAVLDAAVTRHGDPVARVLPPCSVLVDGRNVTGEPVEVSAGSVVDVLPPFAGG